MFKEGADLNNEFVDNVVLQNLISLIDGDYNGDGFVDAADYVVWRKNNGLTGGATIADGDGTGDGNVDDTDYAFWRERFGNPPPGSGSSLGTSNVPEPATTMLLIAAVSAWYAAGSRQGRTSGR
jgi:hypothetical protein